MNPLARTTLTLIRAPFSLPTWKRSAYALASPAIAAISIPLALVGGPSGRFQRAVARPLLTPDLADLPEPRRTGIRALVHAIVALPLAFVALVITGYGWAIVALNIAYPLRPLLGMGAAGDNAWGGPSMAGAWAFHALLGGVPFALLMPWIVRALTWLQARLIRALLG